MANVTSGILEQPLSELPASGGEWIEWIGGDCPVDPGVKVNVKFRRGHSADNLEAGYWRWDHSPSTDRRSRPNDIIAYRVSAVEE